MKKTMFLAGTALLAVASLLFLTGCRNSVSPPVDQTGILQLTISEGNARAILPDVGMSNFAQFRLDFTPVSQGPAMRPFHLVWAGSTTTYTIPLDVGTWNLRVTAFLDGVTGLATMTPDQALGAAVAVAFPSNIAVAPGVPVSVTVNLDPIVAGSGRFSWDITFVDNADIYSASMNISGPGLNTTIDIFDRNSGYQVLPAGLYTVVITLENNAHPTRERVSIPQYLRVYQNLVSHFEEEFDIGAFPQTLLHFILNSWTGTYWDFMGRGIRYWHFARAGAPPHIRGINSTNFAVVNASMDTLTLDTLERGPLVLPINQATLGHLVDVALIATAKVNAAVIGSGVIEPSNFNTETEWAYALFSFAENTVIGTPTTGYYYVTYYSPHASDSAFPHLHLTNRIGVYQTTAIAPRLIGSSVAITAPPPLVTHPIAPESLHRVGDSLMADIDALRGIGTPRYRWYRSAVSYPATPANTGILVRPSGIRIDGATEATYELAPADVNHHIALEARRLGYFGYIISTNMIGHVVHRPVDTTIAIQFTGFNGIGLAVPPGSIRLYYHPTDPTVTLNVAPVAGASGAMTNVRWYIGWNTDTVPVPIATGTSLVINDAIHNRRIGTHQLTVRAYINNVPYSRVITFEVTL